jgi:hypothetical protein
MQNQERTAILICTALLQAERTVEAIEAFPASAPLDDLEQAAIGAIRSALISCMLERTAREPHSSLAIFVLHLDADYGVAVSSLISGNVPEHRGMNSTGLDPQPDGPVMPGVRPVRPHESDCGDLLWSS